MSGMGSISTKHLFAADAGLWAYLGLCEEMWDDWDTYPTWCMHLVFSPSPQHTDSHITCRYHKTLWSCRLFIQLHWAAPPMQLLDDFHSRSTHLLPHSFVQLVFSFWVYSSFLLLTCLYLSTSVASYLHTHTLLCPTCIQHHQAALPM